MGAFAREHDLIALGVHTHREMRRLAVFGLRLTRELTACGDYFARAFDHIRHLEAKTGPGAAAFAALLSGAYKPEKDERVGVVVCGANTSMDVFGQLFT